MDSCLKDLRSRIRLSGEWAETRVEQHNTQARLGYSEAGFIGGWRGC